MGSETASGQDPGPVVKEEANNLYQHTQRRPFPTDSMVTVRLSETSIPPLPDASITINPKPSFCNPLLECNGTDYISESYTQNEDLSSSTNTTFKTIKERDLITSSISNAEEGQVGTRLSDPRLESKSRGSFSSMSSAQFDWDELDKSEEQVIRDEESDEVRQLRVARCRLSLTNATLVNGFPSCQA